MFSQASVILFTGGVCMGVWQGSMHGGGVAGGPAWQGACMAMHGHGWQGACVVGGMHGGGHAWQGACVVGGMHGGGHAWQGWGHVWQERWPLQQTVHILLECILVLEGNVFNTKLGKALNYGTDFSLMFMSDRSLISMQLV